MARYLVAIALLAVIAGTAYAQEKPKQSALAAEAEERKKEADVVDKRYKSVLKNTDRTAAPVRTDPWQNMRGTADSKASQ